MAVVLPIKGVLHSQGSAASVAASLLCEHGRYTISTDDGQTFYGQLSELDVSSRLGNIERKITLKDGSVFSTSNNDVVDQMLKSIGHSSSFIHAIESKMRWVFLAILITIGSVFGFYKWGIPFLSYHIAHALPEKTNDLVAANTLEFLDKLMFDESKLDEQKQNQIREHFIKTLVPLETNKEITYTLHFRYWGDGDLSIPNAFALPSGDIILTDKFVELSEKQAEMDSVLLHEMGHVAERHSLQMIVQSTLITAAVMLVAGDANAIVDMGVGMGSILISSNYSRHHESQADEYAFNKMLQANIDPIYFSNIMSRMTSYMEEAQNKKNPHSEDGEGIEKPESSVFDYLSSHPKTEERLNEAKRYSECFKQGLLSCDKKE